MFGRKKAAKAIVDTGAPEAAPIVAEAPFVAYTAEDAIAELKQYVADNALTIDWKTAATLKNIFNRLG